MVPGFLRMERRRRRRWLYLSTIGPIDLDTDSYHDPLEIHAADLSCLADPRDDRARGHLATTQAYLRPPAQPLNPPHHLVASCRDLPLLLIGVTADLGLSICAVPFSICALFSLSAPSWLTPH